MPSNELRDRASVRSPPTSPTRQYSDRFIPGRRSPTDARISLHLGKRLFELNENEKTLHRQNIGRDPFSYPVRNAPLVAEQYRQLRTPHRSISAGNSIGPSTIGLNRGQHGPSQRAVSQGAVWNVGGSRAASDHPIAVLNGRGGRLASGTNAPLYSSQFLIGPDYTADLDAHERRLALALDVDQNSKILSPPSSPPLSPSASSRSSASPFSSPSTQRTDRIQPIWKDCQWTKEETGLRSCQSPMPAENKLTLRSLKILNVLKNNNDKYQSFRSDMPLYDR